MFFSLKSISLKELADLLHAIAAVLWPVLSFVALLIFRSKLNDVLGRLRRGKFLGQEVELEKSLNYLGERARVVEAESVVGASPNKNDYINEVKKQEAADSSVQKIMEVGSKSPKAGLILLAADIEKTLREFLLNVGHFEQHKGNNPLSIATYLGEKGWLTRNIVETIKSFWHVRNRLVHGQDTSPNDILRAIDSGLTILKALLAIPAETNVVYHPGVPIYRDSECSSLHDGKGLILETTSPGGAVKSFRIFPTTRTDYVKGSRVGWEWNQSKQWNSAWYRDPDTGQIKQAWDGSLEFVGRMLD